MVLTLIENEYKYFHLSSFLSFFPHRYMRTKTSKIVQLQTDKESEMIPEDADQHANQMKQILNALFRAARDKQHHTQGILSSSILTVSDVMEAATSRNEIFLNLKKRTKLTFGKNEKLFFYIADYFRYFDLMLYISLTHKFLFSNIV